MDYLREKNIRQFIHKVRSCASSSVLPLQPLSPQPQPLVTRLGCLHAPHPFLDVSYGFCCAGTHLPRVAPPAACSSVHPALAQP